MCWQYCKRGTVEFKGVTLTIDRFERKGARQSRRGEEWGINKREVTELRGTGGQFSSTQRGQSRGHWPFPPFLSLCPPPSHHSILLPNAHSLCVSLGADLNLPLSSPSFHIFFLSPSFLRFHPPFKLTSFSLGFLSSPFSPLSHTSSLSYSSQTLFFFFPPLHFLCPFFPVWVHWIVMWGAAVLLTKHKGFHIHPAPGILGHCPVCACMRRVTVCVRQRAVGERHFIIIKGIALRSNRNTGPLHSSLLSPDSLERSGMWASHLSSRIYSLFLYR